MQVVWLKLLQMFVDLQVMGAGWRYG
jgi:hypothetical protein